jgi:predicted ABC-type ATPase
MQREARDTRTGSSDIDHHRRAERRGKTTISRQVLEKTLGMDQFVNADTIAQGLSGFHPESAAFSAGRIMIQRLRELGEAQSNFAFESTLASRTFAP